MPIVIDLLAEYHDLEEERRRDPVKRTSIACGVLVGIVALWCVWLQMKVMSKTSQLKGIEAELAAKDADYKAALTEKANYNLLDNRLSALNNLTTNRFLWANVLNALQKAPLKQIEVEKIITDQSYATTAGAVPDPAAEDIKKKLGTPSISTTYVKLIMEARDYSNPAENRDQVQSFREGLAELPYFQKALGDDSAIILKDISSRQTDGVRPNESYVPFTLEFNFPPKTRELMPYE